MWWCHNVFRQSNDESIVGRCWETLWRCREDADGLKSFQSEALFQCQEMPLKVAIAGNQSAIVGIFENAVILGWYGCVMLSYDAYSTSIQNARIWPWYAWKCTYRKLHHPFLVGIRFQDMNIRAGSVAKLPHNYWPCDRYSRRSLSW